MVADMTEDGLILIHSVLNDSQPATPSSSPRVARVTRYSIVPLTHPHFTYTSTVQSVT